MKLELNTAPGEVMRAVETLCTFGRERGIPERALFSLALALEECGSNIVKHGFRSDPSHTFEVLIEHQGTSVTIELRDRGPEFDPTRAPARDSRTINHEERIGGWGIGLVRQHIDEIRYTRDNGVNVLHLTKRLTDASSLSKETQQQT